jgi:hypothetical protein
MDQSECSHPRNGLALETTASRMTAFAANGLQALWLALEFTGSGWVSVGPTTKVVRPQRFPPQQPIGKEAPSQVSSGGKLHLKPAGTLSGFSRSAGTPLP